MFASSVLFSALASMALAAPVARDDSKSAPAGWAYGYLENYSTYHTRYLALDCQDKHDTDFFDQCCHPLLATETLEADRPAQCIPAASAVSSASAVEATATAADAADSDAASQFQAATSTIPAAVEAASPSPSPSPAAAASNDNSNNDSGNNSNNNDNQGGNWNEGGQATFFYQNGNPGACGNYNSDSTPLVAIDSAWWPSEGSSSSPYCGAWVQIVNTENGKSVNAQVQDVCPTCVNGNSLDLSTGAFDQIADESQGSVSIKWKFI